MIIIYLFVSNRGHFHWTPSPRSPTSSWIMLAGHWRLFPVWPVICQVTASSAECLFQTQSIAKLVRYLGVQSGHITTPYTKCPLAEWAAPEGSYLFRLPSRAIPQVSLRLTSHTQSVGKNYAFTPVYASCLIVSSLFFQCCPRHYLLNLPVDSRDIFWSTKQSPSLFDLYPMHLPILRRLITNNN